MNQIVRITFCSYCLPIYFVFVLSCVEKKQNHRMSLNKLTYGDNFSCYFKNKTKQKHLEKHTHTHTHTHTLLLACNICCIWHFQTSVNILNSYLRCWINQREREMFYLTTHSTHFIYGYMEVSKEMFYLTTHSTHFIYGYMASDIWLRTILIVRKETRCHHIGYSFRLTARVLLYVPSHRQDSTYHDGYMVSDIWLRTILIVRKETCCRHIGYSYRLTTRVLLYAPSHRQDNTYHNLCYTSRGALAGTRNISMGPPHEGSIRWPIAPWALPLSYVPLLELTTALA